MANISMLKQKILIIAPSWIGDLVMAEALLEVLHQPELEIDILASPHLMPLLQRFPHVSDVIALPFKHGEFNLKQRYLLAKRLRQKNYTQAIVLPNSWKSALIPFLAKIPLRTGWRGEMRYFLLNDLRALDKRKFPLMVERFIALGKPANATYKLAKLSEKSPFPLPLPKLTVTSAQVMATLAKFDLYNQYQYNKQQKILALCIGAEYGPAKRWPTQYFAQVAQNQISQGWQVWLFGSNKDSILAREIQDLTQNSCIDFTGKTTLDEAVDLLSLSSLAISNDSGLMHVVSALNLPLLAIYGSSTPEFTPPLTAKARILRLNLPCSPCFQRTCPLGHFECMLNLKPDKVIKIVNEISLTLLYL